MPRFFRGSRHNYFYFSDAKKASYTEMTALGKAEIHGIEGVEISATQVPHESNR